MYRSGQENSLSHAQLLGIAAAIALFLGLIPIAAQPAADAAPTAPPSFVVIQTDDQTLDQLYDTFRQEPTLRVMPNTLGLIAKRGMTFSNYYVSYPLCCPARVSLLTGRYAHNHNVRGNIPPNAGYTGFSYRGAASHNLPVWLQSAGYRTIHVGKFLNGYGDEPYDNGTSVPPGWNAWHSVVKADTHHYFYGYTLNNNGLLEGPYGDSGSWDTREYGVRDDLGCPYAPLNGLPCHHITDTLTNIAAGQLLATPAEQPFYLQLDYTAPHGDFRRPAGPEPAPRHYDWFKGAPYPHDRSEGFAEGNVRDKPSFIKEAPYLSLSEIHTYRVYYQKALDSLRTVDDGVKKIIDTLGYLSRLRNTYVIFTSDNGFFFGEHRLTGGKFLAYEPATHLPFLIRGPGIRPDSESDELVGNVDVAPTVLELAGVTPTKSIDGRSMVPFLHDPELRTDRPFLFESFVETADVEPNSPERAAARTSGASASILAPPKDYAGIRLGSFKYIAWPSGEKELYELARDPYELNNVVKTPNYFPIRNFLHREMLRLQECVGRRCQELSPPLPLTRKQRQEQIRQEKKERREKQRERRKKQKAR